MDIFINTSIHNYIMKKILFVCNGNAQRSPTFEKFFKKKLYQKDYDVRSAGIYSGYPYMVNQELIDWADCIYVMDLEQYKFIFSHHNEQKNKLEMIGVSDQYMPDNPELIRLIDFWYNTIKGGKL